MTSHRTGSLDGRVVLQATCDTGQPCGVCSAAHHCYVQLCLLVILYSSSLPSMHTPRDAFQLGDVLCLYV